MRDLFRESAKRLVDPHVRKLVYLIFHLFIWHGQFLYCLWEISSPGQVEDLNMHHASYRQLVVMFQNNTRRVQGNGEREREI